MKMNLPVILSAAALLLTGGPAARAAESAQPARPVLDHYVAIQKAFADDSMEHVADHAQAITKAVAEKKVPGLPPETAAQAEAVAKAKDIKVAREAFKKLSKSFETYLKDHPDTSHTFRVAYCPMAKAGWVQTGETIANPYYGKSMLKCGTFKE